MQEPTLVILAAGMGSRFGGLKQITAVDEHGHAIIDFSLFDAYRAGFRKVAFIIKHEIEEDFKSTVGRHAEKFFDVQYIFQQLDVLPEGFSVPDGRVKPWGTGHAVMCCKGVVEGPFAVINADDFYGPTAYSALYDFMTGERKPGEHAMAAYELRKTLTENGHVARGVCQVENGYLAEVIERVHIEKRGNDAAYTENGTDFIPLSGDAPVSMNCWAFDNAMLDELYGRFPKWLEDNLPVNPLKCEYFLPFVVSSVIHEGRGSVRILNCRETWHGVTYKEDLADVRSYVKSLRDKGLYPENLLD